MQWLSEHHAAVDPNGNGFHQMLCRLVEVHGTAKVIDAFVELRDEGRTTEVRQYLFGADNILNPLPSARRNGKQSHDLLPSLKEAEDAFEHYE